MEQITLTICIPTYNRARYLSVLLGMLAESLGDFKHPHEIVISDNASTDNTEEIVRSFVGRLPIRYFRQISNIGSESSLIFAIEQAKGQFVMYLADDDFVDIQGLTVAIDSLTSHPEAVALYAPWRLYDLVNNTNQGTFYSQPADILIQRNDYASLVKHVVAHRVWPEISIVRTESFKRVMPKFNSLAYWAFTIPCDYLTCGQILFSATPFYISISSYFPDETRGQAGHEETESAWDRYRGGWEYMLGRAIANLTQEEIAIIRTGIDRMVIDRMAVALRLRWQNTKDPVDSYYLACRLRGLGAQARLPTTMDNIRSKAAIWFATHDTSLLRGVNSICCVGKFDSDILTVLRSQTEMMVTSSDTIPAHLNDGVVLLSGEFDDHAIDVARQSEQGNKLIAEADLMRKFC
jgi:glycosyltransferase involved in cell wall biosynthesis